MYSYSYETKEAIEVNSTSERLINISMQTFSDKGYHGTSLNSIANDLGVKKASLYNYINSKDDLYGLCLEKCMNDGINIIENIDIRSQNLSEELLSFFKMYIFESACLVKFYVQLSFAPSNFIKDIEQYNDKLSTTLTYKLDEIHAHHKLNINKDEFVLLIRMFINGWLYRRAFIQSEATQKEVKNEFNIHAKLLLNTIRAKQSE